MDLEDYKNRVLRNPDNLYAYVESRITDGDMYYILLDEVQMLDQFEDVLNGFLRIRNADIYVTGSNAKFLSKDIITEFRGRGFEVKMYPLSFSEYMSAYPGTVQAGFNEYMLYGGLPQILSYQTEEQKVRFLKSLFDETYLKDIKDRYEIRKDDDLEELINIMASGIPCDIYVETLECKSINDAPIWMSQTENMISRYENKGLRAIVLLGQEAWASFVSLGHIPKDVMCFCCYVSSNGIVLPPPEDSLGMWLPPSINYMNMTDSLNNVGGMLNKYDVRRNIELVRSLFPEAENIAFISDNTYGGISLQALVREEMKNYPDMNLVLVDSREGEETAFRTYATLPPRSAVMLGTWRVGSDGEYFMQRSLNDLVQNNPRVPVFSVTGTGIGDTAIGGYVPEYENGAEVIANQIRKYYDTDDIEDAHFHTSKSLYLFDSRKLKEWKIAEYALPKGSVIEDTMAAKLSKYSHYIELLVAGILLLVLRLLYLQKRESLAASADQVLVTVEEVQTELQKMNLPRRLDQQTLERLMRTLRRYNLARPVGRLSGLDSRIEVFPTVLLALPDADLADAAAESSRTRSELALYERPEGESGTEDEE